MKEINNILNRFWEGQTTLDEERQLRSYFSSENVAEKHSIYKPLFDYYQEEGAGSLDFDPFERIGKEEVRSVAFAKANKRRLPLLQWAIAAGVAALVMLGSTYLISPSEKELGTYDDPQIAYQEAREALMLVSSKMEVGRRNAREMTSLNKQTEKIFNLKK